MKPIPKNKKNKKLNNLRRRELFFLGGLAPKHSLRSPVLHIQTSWPPIIHLGWVWLAKVANRKKKQNDLQFASVHQPCLAKDSMSMWRLPMAACHPKFRETFVRWEKRRRFFVWQHCSRWWFQIFVIFTPIWGRFPI